jgi:hypothetical protein
MNNFIIITGLIIILLIIIYFIVNYKIKENFTTTATTTPATTTTTTTTTTATPVIPTSIKLDLLSLLLVNQPYAMYFAKDFNIVTNTLPDIYGREDRDAKATGTITLQNVSGNGAIEKIHSLSGTVDSKIDFPLRSIPDKFTICSITRYTSTSDDNKNRILISTNDNNWAHGHKGGKRGVVYYDELKTANIDITGNATDWVSTCAKNEGAISSNIYINGVASGVKEGGTGGLKLSINNNQSLIGEKSDFALSYLIIWDNILSNDELKIVSDSFINYLATGVPLLYNINDLPNDDKLKVVSKQLDFINKKFSNSFNTVSSDITKTNISLNSMIKETNDKIIDIKNNSNLNVDNSSNQPDIQVFLNKMLELENRLSDVNTKTDNIIKSNTNTNNIQSDICLKSKSMPEPLEKSFTADLTNLSPLSNIDYEQTSLWCLCNDNNQNSKDCVAYSKCQINYDLVKRELLLGKSFTGINRINPLDADVYKACNNLYKNFPKLQTS